MLILASGSPRRRALLRSTGIPFRVAVPRTEEGVEEWVGGSPARWVQRLALAKARQVAERERGLVVAADTIVVCDGELLGKPASAAEAAQTLSKLSGRWHRVYTGLALVQGERHYTGYECTEVAFRRLSKGEIARYVSTGEPLDKAGAYAIQGRGTALVRTIRGCYTNVIGLPLPKLLAMLAQFRRARSCGAP